VGRALRRRGARGTDARSSAARAARAAHAAGAARLHGGAAARLAREIWILQDAGALAECAAAEFAKIAAEAVAKRGVCAVALAGGSTPRALYERLATWNARARGARAASSRAASPAPRIPWRSLLLFWGDERAVRPDSPHSNYRMASEALLSKVPIARGSVHRVIGELGAKDAAIVYDATIRAVLGANGSRATPRFDLVILGLGDDGHTASLFPDRGARPAPRTRPRAGANRSESAGPLVVPGLAPGAPRDRVTLTLRAINEARNVLFIVSGAKKAKIVRHVLGAREPAPSLPATLVAPRRGRLVWMIDRAAAIPEGRRRA
jgi:6-phosphogluconolactonase